MISRIGDNVLVFNRMIPAVNIQTDNVPGWIVHPDGSAAWYGIYFEVMFEDGSLWEVSQGSEENEREKITVTEYTHHGPGYLLTEPNFMRELDNWDLFIDMYEAKLNRR